MREGVGATLRLHGLSKRFGDVRAVDGVDLTIPPGQFVGVIGPSGAGKSTLLRLINRLVEPDGGRITHGSLDVTALRGKALRHWRARAAMIFQQFNLIPRLDVLTNVLIGRLEQRASLPSLLGLFSAAERAEALSTLDRFGLVDIALQTAGTLSGGQQQRVAICRALMQDPWLVLADEPIASLDPRNAQVVMRALREVNRERGLSVLINLHHLDTVREYCDRVVAMRDGRVVLDAAADALTADRVFEIYGLREDEIEPEDVSFQ
jgi:phosphonate transport system ATP-binding protein